MKIEFQKEELLKAVNKINRITSLYKTNVAFNNIKLTAKNNVVLEANNDLAFMNVTLDANIIEEGEVCINSDSFAGVVRSMDSDIITVECNNSSFIMKNDKANVVINTTNLDDFAKIPTLESLKIIHNFDINSRELSAAIANCLPFEDTKSVISGLNIKSQDNSIRLCCCSEAGGCLYYIDNLDFKTDNQFELTIDTRLLRDFKDIFNCGNITVSVFKRLINFKTQNTELTLRVLDKAFPKIEAVIPTSFKAKLVLVKNKVEEAFNLIDIVTDKKDAYFEFGEQECVISHPEGVNFVIDLASNSCENFRIDRELLKKALRIVSSDNIELSYNDLPKPLMIKDTNKILLLSVLVK